MIIVDNSSLSSLVNINQLEILPFFFDDIIIPKAVHREFIVKFPQYNLDKRFKIIGVNELEFKEFLSADKEIQNLGSGDQEVIFHAIKENALVITDDNKIKNIIKLKIGSAVGTLRLLKNAFNCNYYESKSQYFSLIDEIAKDLYLTEDLIKWAKNIE